MVSTRISPTEMNSYYEVSEILKHIDISLKKNIPQNLLDFFEDNKSDNHYFEYNDSLTLDKQDMMPETETILTVLYREFICNENERDQLDLVLRKNEEEYQNELRKKYNPDDIFNNRNRKEFKIDESFQQPSHIATYKTTLFKRIIAFLKGIF